MADKVILVDTSILIDYYRKTDKEKSVWVSLIRQGYSFAISAVTKYEIYSGATSNQLSFWNNVFQTITEAVVPKILLINSKMKRQFNLLSLISLG